MCVRYLDVLGSAPVRNKTEEGIMLKFRKRIKDRERVEKDKLNVICLSCYSMLLRRVAIGVGICFSIGASWPFHCVSWWFGYLWFFVHTCMAHKPHLLLTLLLFQFLLPSSISFTCSRMNLQNLINELKLVQIQMQGLKTKEKHNKIYNSSKL